VSQLVIWWHAVGGCNIASAKAGVVEICSLLNFGSLRMVGVLLSGRLEVNEVELLSQLIAHAIVSSLEFHTYPEGNENNCIWGTIVRPMSYNPIMN